MRTDAPARKRRVRRPVIDCVVCSLLLVTAIDGAAAREPAASSAMQRALDPTTQPGVAVVDAFSSAISSGDLARAGRLPSPAALILERCGAECAHDDDLAGHAAQDAASFKNAHGVVTRRTARLAGNMAWFGTHSELQATAERTAIVLRATESPVLQHIHGEMRIAPIHWSSRARRTS